MAPKDWAIFRRFSLRSTAKILRAPQAAAPWTANRPMGPQPKMTRVLPDTVPMERPWTATPQGSIMAAAGKGISFGIFTAQGAGMVVYSEKIPWLWTPYTFMYWQICRCPVRQK